MTYSIDIPYLVEYFIRKFNTKRGKNISGVTPRVMEMFMQHDFPGNVRELENLIEYGFVLCHDGMIDVHHLPEDFQHHKAENRGLPADGRTTFRLSIGESEVIRAALKQCNGHIGKTAKELGISRTTLWRKMKKYAIEAVRY